MQLKEFNIIIDVIRPSRTDKTVVVQGDANTNVLNIAVTNGSRPYDLYGLDVDIIFKKADGTTVQQINIDRINDVQGKIRCILKTNTIACPGDVAAELRVMQSDKVLTSNSFFLYVRKSLLTDETVESTNELPILTQLISETHDLIDAVRQIEEQVPENVLDRIDALEGLAETMESQIAELQSGKFNKSDLVNVHTDSTTKAPSAALVKADHVMLGTLNDKFANSLKISFIDVSVTSDHNACAKISSASITMYNALCVKSMTPNVLTQLMLGWSGSEIGVRLTDYLGAALPNTTCNIRLYSVDY